MIRRSSLLPVRTNRGGSTRCELEVADLDPDEIRSAVEEAIRRGRLNEPDTREVLPLLRLFTRCFK